MENKPIETIYEEALRDIEAASDLDAVREISVRYLGRKGRITGYLRTISTLSVEERAAAGKRANEIKQLVEEALEQARKRIESRRAAEDAGIDVTLPGRKMPVGALHPITRISSEICDIFERLGFSVAEGPEVETDYYNFEALNVPKYHPARDMQDTFYVSENIVLRTQTSPMQVRVMETQPPPVAVIAPGKVYRCDSDLTHTPMFHQVEGLLVDQSVSFADLKGTLTTFVHEMFDRDTALRFRPSFFPFTEPSAEVDILCVICRGKGCRVCSGSGWLEILGSGMVHPNVFRSVDYDTSRFTGFAFGMGVERIAMLKYGIDDIRRFFTNDMRFLGQF
ncbi:MAG: phenylalanine--tRNA ligase subunit alpha [Desulfobacterales bacterium]